MGNANCSKPLNSDSISTVPRAVIKGKAVPADVPIYRRDDKVFSINHNNYLYSSCFNLLFFMLAQKDRNLMKKVIEDEEKRLLSAGFNPIAIDSYMQGFSKVEIF